MQLIRGPELKTLIVESRLDPSRAVSRTRPVRGVERCRDLPQVRRRRRRRCDRSFPRRSTAWFAAASPRSPASGMRQRGDLAADATSALVVDTRALPQLHLDGRRRRRDRRVVVAAVAVAVLAGAGAAVGRFADPARAPRAPAAAAATDVVLARRDEQRVRWRRALLRARSRREQAAVAARVADAYDAAARKLRLASPRIDGGAQATAASALAAAYAS